MCSLKLTDSHSEPRSQTQSEKPPTPETERAGRLKHEVRLLPDDYRAGNSLSAMMRKRRTEVRRKVMMEKQPESRSNDLKLENETFVFMFILNLGAFLRLC